MSVPSRTSHEKETTNPRPVSSRSTPSCSAPHHAGNTAYALQFAQDAKNNGFWIDELKLSGKKRRIS